MRDFPSCFGENGVQVADASCSSAAVDKASQNSVTSLYRCRILGKSCLITVVWSKNLIGQCLGVEVGDAASRNCLCRVDVKPSLFSKRRGSKSIEVNAAKIEVFWDLSQAKFGPGPEPLECYYVSVVSGKETVLLVGDLRREALKKTGSAAAPPFSGGAKLISKKEHVFGKRVYGTRAQFSSSGQVHDVKIECDLSSSDDPFIVVRVDSKPVMQVKHLRWKFRGNYTILVDGLPVEVFWDVHNWLFGPGSGSGAVFLFQSAEKGTQQSEAFSLSFRDGAEHDHSAASASRIPSIEYVVSTIICSSSYRIGVVLEDDP